MRRSLVCLLVAIVTTWFGVSETFASDEDAAKRHWRRGKELFESGDPVGAIAEWEEGWILSRRPAFLLNIAQAYREMDEPKTAIRYYRLFLTKEPDPEEAAEIEEIIAELEREIGEPSKRRPSPREDDRRDDGPRGRGTPDHDPSRGDRYESPEERRAKRELGPAYERWYRSGLTVDGFRRVRAGNSMLIIGGVATGGGIVGLLAVYTLQESAPDGADRTYYTLGIVASSVVAIGGAYLLYYGLSVRAKGLKMRRADEPYTGRGIGFAALPHPGGASFVLVGRF